MREFYSAWRSALDRLEFEALGRDGRIEYLLFRNKLNRELRQLDLTQKRADEISNLIPFAQVIIDLQEARQRVDHLDPEKAAATLVQLEKQLQELSRKLGEAKPEPRKRR